VMTVAARTPTSRPVILEFDAGDQDPVEIYEAFERMLAAWPEAAGRESGSAETRVPQVGDRAVLYPEGCLPSPVIVTAVADGVITRVRLDGPWAVSAPGQFTVEDHPPDGWQDCMVLFALGRAS
jgi:hypothetical protein